MDAKVLKAIRRTLGLTQKQLSDRLGVSQNTVTRWEIGMHRIPGPAARLLAQMKPGEQREARRKR